MYLSNVDINAALESGKLIIEPRPQKIDPTSVDLHLDSIEQAKIWTSTNFWKTRRPRESPVPNYELHGTTSANFRQNISIRLRIITMRHPPSSSAG